jgi:hypothetical protein
MITPWSVFVVLAFLFFSEAKAADTVEIRLIDCPAKAAPNDPSIVIRKSVQTSRGCEAPALEIRISDTRYGFAMRTKSIGNLSSSAWAIDPSLDDVFRTHKPCRRLFPDRGRMIEWLVPLAATCDGREAGWYYRVYTHDSVCIMPGESCFRIKDTASLSKRRFDRAVAIAYEK